MSEQTSQPEWTVLGELEKLDLPQGSYMVMGSGILDALGIRKSHDIDLVVSDEVYEKLLADGWNKKVSSDGHEGIESGLMEAYPEWTDHDAKVKKIEELLVDAEWVNGIAFNSLAKLSLYKARRGQQKDFADLVLIQEYLDAQKTQA